MSVGQNNMIVPCKIDTGSHGNMMPVHVFRRLYSKVTNKQVAATKKQCILLQKYNKTTITQLGTCTVVIDHKNNKKKCKFL